MLEIKFTAAGEFAEQRTRAAVASTPVLSHEIPTEGLDLNIKIGPSPGRPFDNPNRDSDELSVILPRKAVPN